MFKDWNLTFLASQHIPYDIAHDFDLLTCESIWSIL